MSKIYKPVCQEQVDGTIIAINEEKDVIIAGTAGDGQRIATVQLGNNPVAILTIALYLQHLVAHHMGVNIEELMHAAMAVGTEEDHEGFNINVLPENHNRH